MKFNKSLIFISLLLIFCISLGTVSAAEMNVIDDNDIATVESNAINDEINTVNYNDLPDTSHLYTELEYATGIFNITSDYIVSSTLNIRGNNLIIEGNNHTFYAGDHDFRAFDIRGTNVTIKNINFVNFKDNNDGGAVWFNFEATNGSLIGCNFVNCHSGENGGAVFWYAQNGVLTNCTFVDCIAARDGGGIFWLGSNGSVSYCTFNKCISGFEDGRSRNSGAIFWSPRDGYVLDCVFKTGYDTVKGIKPIYSPSYEITTFDCEYGETAAVLITVDKDVTGNVTVRVDDGQVITRTIKNGYANILINGLSVGVHKLYISYSGNRHSFNTVANLTIYSNSPSMNGSGEIGGESSDKDIGYEDINESGIPMEHTANPVIALILALLVLPLIYRRY